MTTPELVEFVKNEISLGVNRDVINIKLKTQGWSDSDIIDVYNIINQISTKPVLPTQSNIPDQTIQPLESINNANTFSPTQSNHSKKFLKSFIVILVLVVFSALGAVAYGSGYFISTSKLFSQVVDSSKNNTSVAMEINATFDASNMKLSEDSMGLSSEEFKTANFVSKGSFDFSDDKNMKFVNSFNFVAGNIEVGVESRSVLGSLYFNLTKAPNLGFFSLEPFENKWISLPYEDDSNKISDNPLLSASPIDASLFEGLTEEQKQNMTDILNKANFIKITKKHLPEMVNGSLSYHFDFDLDHEGIVSFLKEATDYLKSINNEDSDLPRVDDVDYTKIFDAVNNFKGEAWIGILNHLPQKIVANIDILNPEKKEDGIAKLNITILYSDWNKPVIVEAPEKSTTVQELMSEVMGGMFGDSSLEETEEVQPVESINPLVNAREKAIDSSIKSILSSMRGTAELFYDTNKSIYKGFCVSKGEYGAYSLAIKLPKNTIYKCNDSNTEWAAWAKLPNDEYWCVDSAGLSESSKIIPKGTYCPVLGDTTLEGCDSEKEVCD
jgi:hypothetical protein